MAREKFAVKGRFRAFARSHAGERLWVKYYQRKYEHREEASPAPLTRETRAATKSALRDTMTPMTEQLLADFHSCRLKPMSSARCRPLLRTESTIYEEQDQLRGDVLL
jgi:hypothetical protein